MSEPVRKPNQIPESYSPKDKPEILSVAQASTFASDTIADPFLGSEPPRTSNRITDYRRIQNWENYFLASAICSVAVAAGVDRDALEHLGSERVNSGFHFFSAFTGDMFTYLYSKDGPCDSGVTNYFFAPQLVKRAYAAVGLNSTYVSNSQIKQDFRAVMNAIKASIDKGIPVLAWGMGNVTMGDGKQCDLMPEGCLIGGYDESDLLYVNLYPGPERVTVDDDGYTAITHGLDTTNGLFFVGEQIKKTDKRQLYQSAIDSIPTFLTLPPARNRAGAHYVFGKTAFEIWADTLEADSFFEGKTDDELSDICWNLHCSPYCCVCTSAADKFLAGAVEEYPDLTMAAKLLPPYRQIVAYKDKIWALHGDFYPPMDKFRTHEFRAQIAAILRRMGGVCDEILKVFEEKQ
jgi:hypothetical protein